MTQTQEGAASSATERAEQIFSRAGERLGMLAGQATLRFRHAAQTFREQASRPDQPAPAPTHQAEQPTLERAEVLVDQLGKRVGHWTQVNGMYMKRALARLREDAEDTWVEAQAMRSEWQSKRE